MSIIDSRYADGLQAIKKAQRMTHEQQLNKEAKRIRAQLLVTSLAVAAGVPVMCALGYFLATY